jgi:hypothetical protein
VAVLTVTDMITNFCGCFIFDISHKVKGKVVPALNELRTMP